MKTITRKKGWPKWAKFYAVDKKNGAWLYDKLPRTIPSMQEVWFANRETSHTCKKVRDELPGDEAIWRDSLRRIKEPTHAT